MTALRSLEKKTTTGFHARALREAVLEVAVVRSFIERGSARGPCREIIRSGENHLVIRVLPVERAPP